ncbi:KxYKxGKxW signal peptide domain-containing protein [Streptococcus oricebi]|uniref:Glucosyl transferase n=1 Tax=Streptococcus oricebi TaxID=1547447 RepID=A0ABS5B2T0_9STRE|nr:KxYKxGKxW signal peptide domain-containing protein [Streptococcus oricebi]MBP2623147.1 hypothetical protein [Streptococcus oricebi]
MKVITRFKLHKVKKQWVTIASTAAIALTALAGAGAVQAEDKASQTEAQVQEVQTAPSEQIGIQADPGQDLEATQENPAETKAEQEVKNQEEEKTPLNDSQAAEAGPKEKEAQAPAKPEEAKETSDEKAKEASPEKTEKKTGLITENGNSYYFDENGKQVKDQLVTIDGSNYYFDKDSGRMATDTEATIDGKIYYFNSTGRQVKDRFIEILDDTTHLAKTYHYYDENGEKVKNRFVQITYKNFPPTRIIKGSWVYFDADGNAVTGWQVIDGKKTYFTDGSYNNIRQVRGEIWKIDGKDYYFDKNGSLVTNRKVVYNDQVYKVDENGVASLTNEVAPEEIPNDLKNSFYTSNKRHTYYFDANGQKVTGWQTIEGKEYFFKEDGRRLEGEFIKRDGKEYYLTKDDGEIARDQTAYLDSEKGFLGFDQDGQILKNQIIERYGILYQTDDKGRASNITAKNAFVTDYKGKKYYVNEKSELANGFYEVDGKKWYFLQGEQLKGGFFQIGWNTYYFDADGKRANGYQTIDGKKYYFAPDGKLLKGTGLDQDGNTISSNEETGEIVEQAEEQKKGFVKEDDGYYYYDDKGEKVKDLQTIDGKVYYFDDKGRLYRNILFKLDSGTYYFSKETGEALTNQFKVTDYHGTYYFGADGKALAGGYHTIGNKTYYFLKDGEMAQGRFVEIDNDNYYFDEKGQLLHNQFLRRNNGAIIAYLDKDGKALTGLQTIDGKTFYFDESGYAEQGNIVKIDQDIYYFDPDTSEMVTNRFVYSYEKWKYKEAAWYYLGADGKALKGYQTIDNIHYYFNQEGKQLKGQGFDHEGKTVLTDEQSGKILEKDQWPKANSFNQRADGKWYYINDKLELVKGWQTIDGKKMYFREDGSQVKGEFIDIDSKRYYFDQDSGEMWTNRFAGKLERNEEFRANYTDWYYLGSDGAALTGPQIIDGKEYRFYNKGKQLKGVAWLNEDDRYSFYDRDTGELVRNDFHYVGARSFNTYAPYLNGYIYLDADGKIARGWQTIDGKKMYFEQFSDAGEGRIYLQVKGKILKIDGKLYYFDEDTGEMVTNQNVYYKNKDYRIDENGVATAVDEDLDETLPTNKKNTFYLSHKQYWYYFDENGKPVTGWQTIKGQRLYFTERFRQVKGDYVTVNGKKYYLDGGSGEIVRDAVVQIGDYRNNTYSYFDKDGQLVKDTRINYYGKIYQIDKDGKATEIKQINTFASDEQGNWYYFDEKGSKKSGFQVINGSKYYFDTNAPYAQVKGQLIEIGGKSYYFDPASGELWTNRSLSYEGKNYQIDKDGVATLVQ